MRLLFAACFAGLLGVASHACTPAQTTTPTRPSRASCESICERYQSCEGEFDQESGCISECRSIFSEDGEFDEDSLRHLQALECHELLSFIDGPL